MTINKGRHLHTMPAAIICPACHQTMLCKMDQSIPKLFIEATCQTENCKLRYVRHMVLLPPIDGREMRPDE